MILMATGTSYDDVVFLYLFIWLTRRGCDIRKKLATFFFM